MSATVEPELKTDEDFGEEWGNGLFREELKYEAVSPPNAPERISSDVVVTFGRPSKEQREIIFPVLGNSSGEYIALGFSRLTRFAMPLETWEDDFPIISEPRVRLSTYHGSSYCHLSDHNHPHGGVRSLDHRLNTQQIIEQSKRLIIVPREFELEHLENHLWEVSSLLNELKWDGELMLFEDEKLNVTTLQEINDRITEKTRNARYFANLFQVNIRGLMSAAIRRVRDSLPTDYANELQMDTWKYFNSVFDKKVEKEIDTTALSDSYIGRSPLALQLLYAIRRNFGVPYASLKVKDHVYRREFFPLVETDERHKVGTWKGTGEFGDISAGAMYFRGMWSSFAKRGFFEEFDGKVILSSAAERLLTLLGPELEDVDLPAKLSPYFNGEKSKEDSEKWIIDYVSVIKRQLARRYAEM
jgi:hypothetical protein